MAVKLITDSGCDLDTAQAQELKITLVPMTVRFGETEYLSGVNLSKEEFYNKLTESKELPTTSQPTPYDFEKAFQKVKNAGNEAVVLCVSSVLSGTYQSACIAADSYEDCIHDPAYIFCYHKEWYHELYGDILPQNVDSCECDGSDYDWEDK